MSLFEVKKGEYKENCVENQCLFCNNKAMDGDEICKECFDDVNSHHDYEY